MAITTRHTTSVGQRIAVFRAERGWTQGQLAEASGLTRWTILRLEASRRRPRLETLEKLSKALRKPVGVLLGWRGNGPMHVSGQEHAACHGRLSESQRTHPPKD